MSRPIERRLVTDTGTVLEPSANGGVQMHVRGLRARQIATMLASNPNLPLSVLAMHVAAIETDLQASGIKELKPVEKRVLVNGLVDAAKRAEAAEQWSFLEKFLSVLALGIPFLVDALSTTETEAILETIDRLERSLKLHTGVAPRQTLATLQPDISGIMNLVTTAELRDSSRQMAKAFGGDFKNIELYVATSEHSDSSPLKTDDFEVSSGSRLIDIHTGDLVSHSAALGYHLIRLDNRPVYADERGRYFLANVKPGETPVPLNTREMARAQITPVSSVSVVARFTTTDDPPARKNMPFTWRGYAPPSEVDVSWWGQCHASAMLGALGLSAAKSAVTIYDEKTNKRSEIDRATVSSMLVYLGDGSFHTITRTSVAGDVNRDPTKIDDDKPELFHEFVTKHIEEGLPFTEETHSKEQIWNYPITEASIKEESPRRRTSKGWETPYAMSVTKSDGQTYEYYYTIVRDDSGKIIDSSWTMDRNNERNGVDHAVPDAMVGYLGIHSAHEWRLEAGSSRAAMNGLTKDSANIIADLYFASQADPFANEAAVYVVRKADGTLVQMDKAEFDRASAGQS